MVLKEKRERSCGVVPPNSPQGSIYMEPSNDKKKKKVQQYTISIANLLVKILIPKFHTRIKTFTLYNDLVSKNEYTQAL